MSMSVADEEGATSPAEIARRLAALKDTSPNMRARDAARALGVSEAELLAARLGDGVTRLDLRPKQLVEDLAGVGDVMCLTRNEHCVHERKGTFEGIHLSEKGGVVLGSDIDLRIFFAHWHVAFAVSEEVRSGLRHSIQIFDTDGTATHKVYAVEATDMDAFNALIEKYRADEQSPDLALRPVEPKAADLPDEEIDRDGLLERWGALKDTHDFFPMLKAVKSGRLQALRLAEGAWTERVPVDAFKTGLEKAAAAKLPIMVFVPNPGVIQIHTGPVESLKEMGPWFNVLDLRFNLHLRMDAIAESWIVTKPTEDGPVTALEIFDADGNQIAWMFGERKPGKPELEEWRELALSLRGDAARAS